MSPDHRRRPAVWRTEGDVALSPATTPTPNAAVGDKAPLTPCAGRRRHLCRWAPHELAAFASLATLICLFFYTLKRVLEGPEGQRWRAARAETIDLPAVPSVISAATGEEPVRNTAFLVGTGLAPQPPRSLRNRCAEGYAA